LLLPDVRLSQALEDLRLSLLQLAGFTIFFVDDLNFLANCFVLLFFSFDPFFNSNFFGVDPYSVVNGADLLTTWLELLHLFLLHLSVFAEHLVNFFFNQLSLVFFQFHHLTNLYLWRGLLVVVGESQLIVAGCVSKHCAKTGVAFSLHFTWFSVACLWHLLILIVALHFKPYLSGSILPSA
jgi:hypothetical protein